MDETIRLELPVKQVEGWGELRDALNRSIETLKVSVYIKPLARFAIQLDEVLDARQKSKQNNA